MLGKTIIFSILFIAFSIFVTLALAQEAKPSFSPNPSPIDYVLPFPGILPGHPLFWMKQLRDSLLSLLINNEHRRVEFQQLLADKYFSMGQVLTQQQKYELALKAYETAVSYAEKTDALVNKLPQERSGSVGNLKLNYGEALSKYEQVLSQFPTPQDDQSTQRLQTLQQKISSLKTIFQANNQ